VAIIFAQDIIEVAIVASLSGRPHVNVVHLFNDEGGGNDQSKVEDLRNNWQDHIHSILCTNYVLLRLEWRSLDPSDNNVGTLLPDTNKPVTGLDTAAPSSPNVALLVNKRTANRPRGRRDGRFFLGGITESAVDGAGTIDPGYLSLWQDAWDDFFDGVDDSGPFSGGSGLAVLETTPASRIKGPQHVTLDWRPVTALEVDPKVATQRDRLR
jgi:hypothetical protein